MIVELLPNWLKQTLRCLRIETVEETRTLLFGIHSNLNFDGYSVYYRPNWEWDRDWILDLDTGIWHFGQAQPKSLATARCDGSRPG